MEDLIAAAELRVFVGDGVEAVRTARDHLLHAVLRERRDVLLRLQLPEVFVTDPACRIAVAGLFRAKDGELDVRGPEDRDESPRHALVAAVDRGGAADEVEVFGVGVLRERRHAELLGPVAPGVTRLAPGIS